MPENLPCHHAREGLGGLAGGLAANRGVDTHDGTSACSVISVVRPFKRSIFSDAGCTPSSAFPPASWPPKRGSLLMPRVISRPVAVSAHQEPANRTDQARKRWWPSSCALASATRTAGVRFPPCLLRVSHFSTRPRNRRDSKVHSCSRLERSR